MKYKTMKLNNGLYAVKVRGNRYFEDTIGTFDYAEEQALIYSMRYYQSALDDATIQLNNLKIAEGLTSIFGGVYLLQKDGVIEGRATIIDDLLA